jgi:Flp pilus assembly pilin Flp
MSDLATRAAANVMATLHVMGGRLENRLQTRSDRGQAAAEYVGILVFVALLIVAIIALVPNLGSKVSDAINSVFDKITESL